MGIMYLYLSYLIVQNYRFYGGGDKESRIMDKKTEYQVSDLLIQLEAIREEKGISATDISKRLGMARSAFYKKKSPAHGDKFSEFQIEAYARELGYELGLVYKLK